MKKIANKLKNYHLSKHSILICCLILMTIGYATVSSKLSTNGSALLAVNLSNLDCYIGNVFVDSKNHFDYLSDDLSSFTFTMSESSLKINYYIRNNATEYDESAKLSCSASDNTTLNITNNFDSLIGAQQINSGEMTISKSDTTEKTILCRLTYENVSRDTTVKKNKAVFYSSIGASIDKPYTIYDGNITYDGLPNTVRGNSIFLGWFNKNKENINEKTKIEDNEDEILYADWSILHARYIKYDNTKSKSTRETVQCAIDEINSMLV